LWEAFAVCAAGTVPELLPKLALHVVSPAATPATKTRSPVRDPWAMLVARLLKLLSLICPNARADTLVIVVVSSAAGVEIIVARVGVPRRSLLISD
jgi:hypothetical protein